MGRTTTATRLFIKKRQAGSERWREMYRYAVRSGCSSLEDLMAQHRRDDPSVAVTQKSEMSDEDE